MTELNFQEKLASLRANTCEQLPTPEWSILARCIARLRRRGFHKTCLQVGETAPDFEFIDRHNTVRRFYDVLQDGPAVLNFFRGYWCSFCRTEIEAYRSVQPRLEALGCSYFAISPQESPADLEAEIKALVPPGGKVLFDHLYDKDNRIAHQFGIVYPLEPEEQALFESWGLMLNQESERWELPIPATFVVRQDRTIGYEYVDVDFRARCCPDELVSELQGFA